MAKHLSLKMNEVNFYEPFMEEPAILPGRPLSEMDIVEFVNQHRRSALSFFPRRWIQFKFVICSVSHTCDYFQGNTEEATGREYVWNMGEWSRTHHTSDNFTVCQHLFLLQTQLPGGRHGWHSHCCLRRGGGSRFVHFLFFFFLFPLQLCDTELTLSCPQMVMNSLRSWKTWPETTPTTPSSASSGSTPMTSLWYQQFCSLTLAKMCCKQRANCELIIQSCSPEHQGEVPRSENDSACSSSHSSSWPLTGRRPSSWTSSDPRLVWWMSPM